MNELHAASIEQEGDPIRTPDMPEVPNIAGFAVGDGVEVTCPGHRHNRRTGTVSYLGTLFLTVGVSIDGEDYGFFPAELTSTTQSQPERQP